MTIRFKQFLLPCVAAGCIFLQAFSVVLASSPSVLINTQLERGIAAAQACEAEVDDDLTSYGECVGHAADRLAGQRRSLVAHSLVGLYFQAWLIADLAARQGSTRSAALRGSYQQALARGLRSTSLTVQQLCTVKQLDCEPVMQRLRQKIAPN